MSEEVPEQKSNKSLLDRIPLSETLMLATVPILAYVVVFVFEIGHLSFFQLPAAFVVFDFTNIFLVAASLLLVGVVIYYYGDTFYEAIKISPDPIRRRLRKVFPSIVIFLAFFFIYSEFWREWIFALIAVLVLTLPSFITPLITQRKTKGYLAKLEAEDKINDNKAKAKK